MPKILVIKLIGQIVILSFIKSFISENYPKGYNSYDIDIKEKEILYCVATFINFKYLIRAASITNQLKGFNKTVGNIWNVTDKSKQVEVKINYNNYYYCQDNTILCFWKSNTLHFAWS